MFGIVSKEKSGVGQADTRSCGQLFFRTPDSGKEERFMKAVVSVIGKDRVGILAAVASKCAEFGANIIDVSQTVMQGIFTMIMLVDVSGLKGSFGDFAESAKEYGKDIGMDIRVMHEDIFNSMHRI